MQFTLTSAVCYLSIATACLPDVLHHMMESLRFFERRRGLQKGLKKRASTGRSSAKLAAALTSVDDFAGVPRVRPQVPDCPEFIVCCFVLYKTVRQTIKRIDGQLNILFWRHHESIPCFCVSSSALSQTKGDDSKSSLVFSKPKNHSSDFEVCHYRFTGVHGGRTTAVLCPRMRSNYCTQQQTRRQRL